MSDEWLKNNVTSLLALFWSAIAAAIFFVVLTKDIKSDDKTVYLIIQGVFSVITFMMGYYYGASKNRPEINSNNSNNQNQETK